MWHDICEDGSPISSHFYRFARLVVGWSLHTLLPLQRYWCLSCHRRLHCSNELGPFLTKKKITIRDVLVVNRDFFWHDLRQKNHVIVIIFVTIHNQKITNHDTIFFSFSLKQNHDSRLTSQRGGSFWWIQRLRARSAFFFCVFLIGILRSANKKRKENALFPICSGVSQKTGILFPVPGFWPSRLSQGVKAPSPDSFITSYHKDESFGRAEAPSTEQNIFYFVKEAYIWTVTAVDVKTTNWGGIKNT